MVWKRVEGFDHNILASEKGEILDSTTVRRPKVRMHNGYPHVTLLRNGKPYPVAVHRLVCMAFHGEPSAPNVQVDHINGDKTDNRATNLEWVTPGVNVRRAKSKRVRGVAPDGTTIEFPYLAMAAEHGFNVNGINKAINRPERRQSQGFVWEYV